MYRTLQKGAKDDDNDDDDNNNNKFLITGYSQCW
jgi:hypothetical protein